MSEAGNGAFYLEKDGFTVVQHDGTDMQILRSKVHDPGMARRVADNFSVKSNAYNVKFLGANPSPLIIPDKAEPTVNNYFIGNDESKWAPNCKIYHVVTYKDVYPGIDVRYYSDAGGRLKYDIIVQPGADVNQIALKYNGIEKLEIKNRELHVGTSIGTNKELYPYSYQVTNNERNDVDVNYEVKNNVVKFKIRDYQPSSTLIIDPTEIFFSYTGSSADNWGFTATYGPDGSFYSGGIVFGSGYPVSTGAYKESFNGGAYDIGIMKLSPNGSQRIYATYIGGSGDEQPHSLIVDNQGNLILAGRSNSSDYPTTVPTIGGGGYDIIVTKLNASGSALVGSMKIGGSGDDGMNIKDREVSGVLSLNRNYGDDARSEVILDKSNNIYVASCTRSTNFPTSLNAFQKNAIGLQDAVLLKLTPNANGVIFSTLLGGNKDDAAYVLALGSNNSIYVAGGTGSSDFRGISSSGVISTQNSGGDCDGFVMEVSNDGSSVLKGTYLGTSAADQIYGIETDKNGNVYVMGTTEGSWVHTNAAFFNPGGKQFISKLKPDLSDYIYSTTFGSGSAFPNISPTAFLVDRCENVYVSGWGGKSNILVGYQTGTVLNMPLKNNVLKQRSDASGSDFYFFVLEKDAASQLYGDFFGQEDPPVGSNPQTFGDHVDGGTSRFDKNGVIYQAMCANCNRTVNFPGTPGSWSVNNMSQAGGKCNLGMLKIALNFAGVSAAPRATINGNVNDTSGCIPLTVNFEDTLPTKVGKSYEWDFGDGSPKVKTQNASITHVYNSIGRFLVMLVAIDSTTCNITDTAYLHIKAGDNKAKVDFISNKVPPCNNLTYQFTNNSIPTRGAFKSGTFTWDFGDGSSKLITGTETVSHTYGGPGTYKVDLLLTDTSFCNSPSDTLKVVRLSPNLKASFSTPGKGCQPYNAIFTNTSAGGLNFVWDFGDGTTSTADNPTHLYNSTGTYFVKLYAFDSTACNKEDSSTFTITVSPVPTSSFTYSPNPPQENTFSNFTNLSKNGDSYLWKFGDGDTSIEVNPKHIFPSTGIFNVCLKAINYAGCSADTCIPVSALINPVLDVPKAFTPGKQGSNSTIFVKGFGIANMKWSIYNRWGQKIFESESTKIGWDGTYKGRIQPLDVYTYTLDALFSDGKKVHRAGDITLLR
ncbi:MAG: hypothetical protein NVSMB45_00040 [Ginsengibacter sp.]